MSSYYSDFLAWMWGTGSATPHTHNITNADLQAAIAKLTPVPQMKRIGTQCGPYISQAAVLAAKNRLKPTPDAPRAGFHVSPLHRELKEAHYRRNLARFEVMVDFFLFRNDE